MKFHSGPDLPLEVDQGRIIAEQNQCEQISWRCVLRACRPDGQLTAQVLHSAKYRETSHNANDQTTVM